MSSERRAFVRSASVRAVKLQTGAGGRYFAGQTHNVSAGGALIRLTGPARVIAGDRLRIGMGSERQAVVASSDLVQATVLRAFEGPGGRYLAVKFDQPQATMAAAAA